MTTDAERRWLDHYEQCETCIEGPEANEFNYGEPLFCGTGMALKAVALVESQKRGSAT